MCKLKIVLLLKMCTTTEGFPKQVRMAHLACIGNFYDHVETLACAYSEQEAKRSMVLLRSVVTLISVCRSAYPSGHTATQRPRQNHYLEGLR